MSYNIDHAPSFEHSHNTNSATAMNNYKKQLAIFLWMALTTSVSSAQSFALVEQSTPSNIASLAAAPSIERERLASDLEEERIKQQAVSNKCSPNLQLTYPDGEKGCLTDLPVSKKISKNWEKIIGEVVKKASYYAIVVSESCDVFEVITENGGNHNLAIPSLNRSVDRFIRSCTAECKCATAVMNGSVLFSKSLAMTLGSPNVEAIDAFKIPDKNTSSQIFSKL